MAFAPTSTASGPTPAYAFEGAWPATPNNMTRALRAVLKHFAHAVTDASTLDAVGAAVGEAVTNSVYHAYVGQRIGRFRITAEILTDELAVTVEDDGCGFDPESVLPGAGLPLIAAFALRVETTERSGGGMRTAMWFPRA
jgi:anti-sigma regulatory factor (Ser/Thr protein kinase)